MPPRFLYRVNEWKMRKKKKFRVFTEVCVMRSRNVNLHHHKNNRRGFSASYVNEPSDDEIVYNPGGKKE